MKESLDPYWKNFPFGTGTPERRRTAVGLAANITKLLKMPRRPTFAVMIRCGNWMLTHKGLFHLEQTNSVKKPEISWETWRSVWPVEGGED